MAKIIQFTPRSKNDAQAVRLVKIADQIDAILLNSLEEGKVDEKDLAALLAHRLGTLLERIGEKDMLWDFCEKVIRKQAKLDKIS